MESMAGALWLTLKKEMQLQQTTKELEEDNTTNLHTTKKYPNFFLSNAQLAKKMEAALQLGVGDKHPDPWNGTLPVVQLGCCWCYFQRYTL